MLWILVLIIFRGFSCRMILLRGSSPGSSSEDPCANPQWNPPQRIFTGILFGGSLCWSLQRIFVGILFRWSLCGSSSEDSSTGWSSSEDLHGDLLQRSLCWSSSEDRPPVGRSSSEDPCADPLQRIVVTHELERLLVLYHLSSHSSAYTVIGLLIIKSSIITIFQSTSSTYQDFLHRALREHLM